MKHKDFIKKIHYAFENGSPHPGRLGQAIYELITQNVKKTPTESLSLNNTDSIMHKLILLEDKMDDLPEYPDNYKNELESIKSSLSQFESAFSGFDKALIRLESRLNALESDSKPRVKLKNS